MGIGVAKAENSVILPYKNSMILMEGRRCLGYENTKIPVSPSEPGAAGSDVPETRIPYGGGGGPSGVAAGTAAAGNPRSDLGAGGLCILSGTPAGPGNPHVAGAANLFAGLADGTPESLRAGGAFRPGPPAAHRTASVICCAAADE